jgi:hypothetical protein
MAGYRHSIRRPNLERLGTRLCMSADLLFVGSDGIGGTNLNVSSDSGTSLERVQSEMSLRATAGDAASWPRGYTP